MRDLLRLLSWLTPYRRQVAIAVAATVVTVGVNILVPLQTARIVDEGVLAGDRGVVGITMLRMLGLVLGAVVLSSVATVVAVRVAYDTAADIRADLHRHVQTWSFANLDQLGTGELLTRLTSDVGKVQLVVQFLLSFLGQAPLMLLGAVIAMLTLRPDLTLVLLAIIPIVLTITWIITARSRVLFSQVQSRLDRLNTVLRENLVGARVVRAFVRGPQEAARFGDVNDQLTADATAVNQLVAMLLPALVGIMNLGTAVILWFGGSAVIDGLLLEGELLAFINYLLMAAMPLIIFAMVQPFLAAGAASASRIVEVLDAAGAVGDPADDDAPAAAPDDVRDTAHHRAPAIELRGVSFAYGHGEPILEDVNLRIERGTTVAILGATGSGKSTLVHLIPRFYDPTAGTVLVDGVDVAAIPQAHLRARIGISLQKATLFSGSVADNIGYARPEASREQVRAAAAIAQADQFIADLPEGYDSPVEAGGVNFSGGQRQRLAIARAIVGDPPILILDDSTSAVDVATESAIQEGLAGTGVERTTIIVAQRISTALAADVIVVLDHGRIVARGSHDELIGTSTVYAEIYRSQLGEPAEAAPR